MSEAALEVIVDVLRETFTPKYYIVKIPQTKNRNASLSVRKKQGRLIVEEKTCLEKNKIKEIVDCVFSLFSKKYNCISDYYFVYFKFIRQCSGYRFHFLISCRGKYINSCFLE